MLNVKEWLNVLFQLNIFYTFDPQNDNL